MTLNRRQVLLGLSAAALGATGTAAAKDAQSRATAFTFSFKALEGGVIRLSDYSGRPILIVNTASLCGYTPQYAGLEALWQRYRDRGLTVLGVPTNDFGSQEPGEAAEIHATAHRHNVTFPLTEKVSVRGETAHPFYRWAALQRPTEIPRWNFHKYLVGRSGTLAASFGSATEPKDARIIVAIEKELASA